MGLDKTKQLTYSRETIKSLFIEYDFVLKLRGNVIKRVFYFKL